MCQNGVETVWPWRTRSSSLHQLPVRQRETSRGVVASEPPADFTFSGSRAPRREAADAGALTRRHAAAADGANEAVGSLDSNWAVSAKTGVRHLLVTEEHLVASRPSTGPSLSLWCDINSTQTEKERNWRKWQTNWRLEERRRRETLKGPQRKNLPGPVNTDRKQSVSESLNKTGDDVDSSPLL